MNKFIYKLRNLFRKNPLWYLKDKTLGELCDVIEGSKLFRQALQGVPVKDRCYESTWEVGVLASALAFELKEKMYVRRKFRFLKGVKNEKA